MDATITHRGLDESLTFPILEEAGTPLFSVDVGYPELNIYESGELEPRFNDTRSQLETYSLVSQLRGPDAYLEAIQLAEFIKTRTGGAEELTLEVSGEDIPNAYPTTETLVAPAAEQARALELTYAPGRTNVVDVELQLTRINAARGETNQIEVTPTESVDEEEGETPGPIELRNGSSVVELSDGFSITRTVGRPNTTIRATTSDYPNYTDQRKTAFDGFDIEFQFVEDGPSKADIIKNQIFQARLGRDPLVLDFNGLFDLGAFNVVPDGSQSLRVQRIAAQKSIEQLPTVSLRRVQ